MKKTFALLLCIVLCFYFIPLPLSAAGMIQYKAIIETGPDSFEVGSAESVSDAVYYAGVVVYSLDAEYEPIEISDSFDGFHDKTVILSNVFFNGYIDCDELYLLGNAKMIVENENMEITGISVDNEQPKDALTEENLESYENLETALSGAEKKYTITGDLDIDYPLSVYELEIEENATVNIKASGGNSNGIIVSRSIVVHGRLLAEEGQTLEIRDGCNTVVGLTLYEDDGTTVFTNYGTTTETFEYRADEEEGKWVRRPGGPPPMHFNDNHFQILFDDWTPDNGHSPEVKYQIAGGDEITVTRDETVQFFQNGDGAIASIAFSMKPAQFEDNSYETFYRVRITQSNDPEHPVEYSLVDEAISFNNDTNTYSFTVTPVEKGSDYEGFRVEIFWTEEAYNGTPGDPGGDDPQNTYNLTLEYNSDCGSVFLDRFDDRGYMFEPPRVHQVLERSDINVKIEPAQGYIIQEVRIDDDEEPLLDETGKPVTEYTFTNITEDHTLHVEFGKKDDCTMHTITVTAGEGGTVEAEGLDDGIVQVEDMFDHMFTFRPEPGWHLKSVIVDKGKISEMDMTHYGVMYNGDGSFSLNLEEVSQDITLEITFETDNAEDITFKKYVVTADNNTSAEIAEALAREFGYISYAVDPNIITVENINPSGINTVGYGYGTFDFSVTIGETLIEDQGFIVPTYEYIIFEFDGTHVLNPVDEIRVLTPEGIENMEFGVPAMDSGSIRVYGANGMRLEGILSSDVSDAFIDGTRNEAVIGRAFYRAQWHMGNAIDIHDPRNLNIFGLNLIQDNAFCVEVAASDGEDEQRTYTWDLNRYAQLTTGDYTSYVFFGNDIFTLRPPESGIGGLDSLVIETGDFPGYTITKDENDQYIITFLSDFYDEITLDLLINGSAERKLTIHRVGVHIVEAEKGPDSNYGQVGHGTQQGTDITFNGENNYQLFATYYIPDFGDTAPYGLYVTYTWANGTTTTQIITEPVKDGNINTGPDFDGVFLDDVNDDFVSCCDYRLYSAPNKNAAPVKVNVIVLRDNPLDADTFGGVHFGSGSGVEWIRDD